VCVCVFTCVHVFVLEGGAVLPVIYGLHSRSLLGFKTDMRHLQLFESVGDCIGEGSTSDQNVVDAIMENTTRGKRNFNDVTSLLHGRLPEYPIAQRFLEIGFIKISTCANSVYQAFLLPLSQTPGYEAKQQPARSSGRHS